jgi:UDP-GlcNAc:undecaprenyl-phosphate GlcNAc-1-phosphate transferase
MIIAISFALALFISMFLVPIAMRYAPALGLIDQPDEARKVHRKPIPRVGGVAITLAFFVPVVFWLHNHTPLYGLLAGALIIALFGYLDDRYNLNYKWKFLGQILAVTIFLCGDIEIIKTPILGFGDVYPWASHAMLALFVLGVTNAVNLSDGLDGLAAGSSLLSLGFIAVLAFSANDVAYSIVAVSAMGALTGFLRFNTHPASVFMGDTGSQFLGFIAACLAVTVTQSENLPVSALLPILIVGLPILDTLMVMVLRIKSGESPFYPDQRHIHHQLLKSGFAHYQAVGAIYLINFLLLAMAYVVRYENDSMVLGAYIIFSVLTLLALITLRGSALREGFIFRRTARSDRRNPWLRRLTWLHQHGARMVQYVLGCVWLLYVAFGERELAWIDLWLPVALLTLMVNWRYYGSSNKVLGRVIFYTISVFSVHIATYEMPLEFVAWRSLTLLDIPLIALVLALVLAIRTTRREIFRMDTQDILVLLVLLAAPLLTMGGDDRVLVGAILRLAVLLYAAEYVVARLQKPIAASVFALLWMAVYLAAALI